MPPLPAVPNVLRVDWLWSDSADVNVSTREYYRYTGSAPNSSACATIATDINALQAAQSSFWLPQVVLLGTKVQDMSDPAGGVAVAASTQTGGRAGTTLAAGTSVLVNFQIARRYRGGKPRNYFPLFGSEDLSTRQLWEDISVSSLQTSLADYYSSVSGIAVSGTTIGAHVNVSFYEGFTNVDGPTGRARARSNLRTGGPVVDTINSFVVAKRVSSQRRRNRA